MGLRWAFDLDMSAIRLLKREDGVWKDVAVEALEGRDIADRLARLISLADSPVHAEIFLPASQILYTDVAISSADAASVEIEAALDGITPYTLDELEIDWELSDEHTARVAAIARETLDEAAAFAEMRGITVLGFSSLATAQQFPRLPDFGGGSVDLLADDPIEAPVDPVPRVAPTSSTQANRTVAGFTSRRKTEAAAGATADDIAARLSVDTPRIHPETPVIQVEDDTPVMRVADAQVPPLDPGQPLERAPSAPRIATDLPVPGKLASESTKAAASLAPSRGAIDAALAGFGRQPQGSSATNRNLVLVSFAALLTLGIAVIVWSIIPGTQDNVGLGVPSVTAPEATASGAPDEDATELVENTQPPEIVTETHVLGVLDANAIDDAPTDITQVSWSPEHLVATTSLLPVVESSDASPGRPTPLARTPAQLRDFGALTPIAILGLPPESFEKSPASDGDGALYFASIDPAMILGDAISLPDSAPFIVDAAPEAVDAVPPMAVPDEIAEDEDATEPAVEDPLPSKDIAVVPENAPTDLAALTPPTGEIADPPGFGQAIESALADVLPAPSELALSVPDERPKKRPASLVDEAERARFGGRTRQDLAGLRPPRRPESAQLAATNTQTDIAPTDLAVATSLAPRLRPSGLSSRAAALRVQREAEAIAASTPSTDAAVAAALDIELEPEETGVRPQDTPRLVIPSDADVARRATIDNAIKLGNINLIGVYGLPNDRRALVRLSNGRFVKVKVGDRIDGGKVAAIGEDALSYTKGGRTRRLEMPSG